MLPGPAVPGCSLVSFHFLWAILCPQAVNTHTLSLPPSSGILEIKEETSYLRLTPLCIYIPAEKINVRGVSQKGRERRLNMSPPPPFRDGIYVSFVHISRRGKKAPESCSEFPYWNEEAGLEEIYWVRLKCFYVVARFSANFSENCSEADSGRLWGSRGKFKNEQAF